MRQISDKQVAKLASLLVGLKQLVDSLESQGFVLGEQATKRIAEFTAESRCLFCGLPLEGEVRRGCHQACYNTVKTRIAKGEITERHAVESEGWLTPMNAKPGRKSSRPDPMRVYEAASVREAEKLLSSVKAERRRDKGRDTASKKKH